MDNNWTDYLNGRGQSFNPYSAGNKRYGAGQVMDAPNVGPTNSPEGYDQRDRMAAMKRNALLKRMQAGQNGRYMSAEWLSQGGQTR